MAISPPNMPLKKFLMPLKKPVTFFHIFSIQSSTSPKISATAFLKPGNTTSSNSIIQLKGLSFHMISPKSMMYPFSSSQ